VDRAGRSRRRLSRRQSFLLKPKDLSVRLTHLFYRMIPCRLHPLLGLLLAALPGAFLSAQAPVLPEQLFPQLDGFLRHSATQSPRMISRGLDLEMADATRDAYRAGLWPSVSGSYRISETRDDRADQPDTLRAQKVYYDITINQAVFHWGAVRNNARIGDIQLRIAQGNFREGYRLLAQEIRSQYLQLIVKKAQIARSRFNMVHVRELLRVAEDRLAKRAISEGEVAVARLNVEQAELLLDRQADDFEASRSAFARFTGSATPLSADEIPDSIPALTPGQGVFDAALASVLSASTVPTNEARNYQNYIDLEVLNYKMNRVRLLPKVNLIAGANQDEQSYTINTAQRYRLDSIYGAMQVSWHIFDGFAARSAQRTALARRRQLENDLRNYTENIKASLQAQNRQIAFAARAMALTDRNVNGSDGLLKSRREDLRSGQASEADVRVAELAVHDAKISAYASRLDYLMKASELNGLLAQDPALANLPQE